jgi:hypothetical protein
MSPWLVECFVWPYFPACENRRLVGEEHPIFGIDAEDFDDAVKQGKNILSGIRTNPNVWKTGIKCIQEVSP